MNAMEHDAVKALISEAIAPLKMQIRELRAELEALKANFGVSAPDSNLAEAISSSGADSSVVNAEGTVSSSSEPLSEIPPERTNFMRFIQRGLEQEEKEYKDEPTAKAEKKAGWNPFKR
jgi:hypothetical protein